MPNKHRLVNFFLFLFLIFFSLYCYQNYQLLFMGFLTALFLAIYIRSELKKAGDKSVWLQYLVYFALVNGLMLIIDAKTKTIQLIDWLGYISLLGFLYIIFKQAKFERWRLLSISFLPLIVFGMLSDLFESAFPILKDRYDIYFDIGNSAGVIWLIGSLFLFRRQNKALAKEQALRAAEAEENQRNLEKKLALEDLVNERTSEILTQKEALEKAFKVLEATQQQLIQSEKMASLGELTAGIAHEIQNPLNFVNNFAELNTEMAIELLAALAKNDLEDAADLANTIKENAEKIQLHGKRADSIVKGMLLHSRKNTGIKEPTDLNVLTDEYLRLAYHGLRAKDKAFNAIMHTNYDKNLPLLNIVPQDIGRVLMNLVTNAFYTVHEKKLQQPANFDPTLWVNVKAAEKSIVITIKDNGKGIPSAIQDKIFQPFFTTKPTGQGTGLGLSLSYDIIKAHGGELQVESVEGSGSEFTIILPFV